MEHRDGAAARERDRQAVGGEDQEPRRAQRRRLAVGVLRLCRPRGDPLDACAVDLAALNDVIEGDVEGGCQPAAVLVHRGWLVVRPPAEVEARVRALRYAAAPGGEEHTPAGQLDPDVVADQLERGGEIHVADGIHGRSVNLRPLSGRRFTLLRGECNRQLCGAVWSVAVELGAECGRERSAHGLALWDAGGEEV